VKIFIFGSLLSQEVLNTVLGVKHIQLNKIPQTSIKNYKATYVQNESYPMLIAHKGSVTYGKIISIENDHLLERLKFYEGDENPLTLISSKVDSLYAFIADSTLSSSSADWSYQEWYKSTTHTDFLLKVEKYMSYFDSEIKAPW